MLQQLFHEILMARKRVYAIAPPTPLEPLHVPVAAEVFIKREDLSPIHSYKWRGAFNRMSLLSAEERSKGVICASAGNHAQGVALAARHLDCPARIYMPVSTPRMKQQAVALHGGNKVQILLTGDNYDAAAAEALEDARTSGCAYIHAYDDLGTMGGQGTLADEVVMAGKGAFDVAYLQIGGGGMAAAVSCWLREYYPGIRIVGVEGVDQASMAAAVTAGHPVTLDHVDVFCDGTAVKKAGKLTHALCADLIDEFITVTNEEVSAAIELLWAGRRCIAEPSGAMGLAGLMKQGDKLKGQRVLTICCGANLDFEQLAWIAQHAAIGAARRRYFRFTMDETPDGLRMLLDQVLSGINIVEVQYGKVNEKKAYPVIGLEAPPPALALLERRLAEMNIPHEEVTSEPDVEFRIIQYDHTLFNKPYFITLDFPERPGALRDFLLAMENTANICYFNYTYTGEQVGRALIGFEFADETSRQRFLALLAEAPQHHAELSPDTLRRIVG